MTRDGPVRTSACGQVARQGYPPPNADAVVSREEGVGAVEFPMVPYPPKGDTSREDLLGIYGERVEALLSLESEVASLENDLDEFRLQFGARCGRLAMELADLELEIARLLLERRPDDPVARARLRKAEETAGRRRGLEDLEENADGRRPTSRVRRTGDARALYYQIARRIHPDLARDPADASARHEAMVHLNWLYARGDVTGLHEMLQDCMRGTTTVATAGLSEYFARAIAAMNRRIEVLRARQRELQESDDAMLRDEMLGVATAKDLYGEAGDGSDPFERLAAELELRVGYTRQRLEQLQRSRGSR